MFLSVAALMPLAHGDLSRTLGDVYEWLCVHIIQPRFMTALTEKIAGKVICNLSITEVMLPGLVLIQQKAAVAITL